VSLRDLFRNTLKGTNRIRLGLVLMIAALLGLMIFSSAATVLADTSAGALSQAVSMMSYGSGIIGTLTSDSPVMVYAFNGTEGDLVSIRVIGVSAGLDLSVSLIGPNQQQIGSSDGDRLSPNSGDARLSYRLPGTGTYTVLVGGIVSQNGGDFLLRLDGAQPAITGVIDSDALVQVNLPIGAPPQLYQFNANPNSASLLTLRTDSPGFTFGAEVRDADGRVVAQLDGSTLRTASLTFDPGTGVFDVVIFASNPAAPGSVVLSVVGAAALNVPANPASTPEAQAVSADSQCFAQSATGAAVNIRRGPDMSFSIDDSLEAGQSLAVINRTNGWLNVSANGQSVGWVAQAVVSLSGDCSSISLAVPAPNATPEVRPAAVSAPSPNATPEVSASAPSAPNATPEVRPPRSPASTPEVYDDDDGGNSGHGGGDDRDDDDDDDDDSDNSGHGGGGDDSDDDDDDD
jgi:SH3-like domain-containing protein